MKKFGFTLTEVLLALSIVGIVSALTIPTLISENQKRTQASTLSVAVSNFETAMRSMITAEDANDLFDTKAWRDLSGNSLGQSNAKEFMGNIVPYLDLLAQGAPNQLYNGNIGAKAVNSNNNAPFATLFLLSRRGFVASNGVFYLMGVIHQDNANHVNADDAKRYGINLTDIAGYVIIDVNGARKPNKVAHDLFFFVLGADGVLYPYGSKDAEYILSNGARVNENWSTAGANFQCRDANITQGGIGCTARLIENGYKMDY